MMASLENDVLTAGCRVSPAIRMSWELHFKEMLGNVEKTGKRNNGRFTYGPVQPTTNSWTVSLQNTWGSPVWK